MKKQKVSKRKIKELNKLLEKKGFKTPQQKAEALLPIVVGTIVAGAIVERLDKIMLELIKDTKREAKK